MTGVQKVSNLFRKKTVTVLEPYTPGMSLAGISVSELALNDGSPKQGDMIAHNPDNPDDRWLLSAEYVEQNYVPA